ncbi:hypothetical protein EVAR_17241_1 [Eumeta japonica]|uniref:Uncharacterized protein n=1 Tax=Eumeta variegata TaxID=151549 RepID=A0A4C1TSX5_EUMVA|nr:hypothetical protein EVAR_17241_1 [Eumeta japonica]
MGVPIENDESTAPECGIRTAHTQDFFTWRAACTPLLFPRFLSEDSYRYSFSERSSSTAVVRTVGYAAWTGNETNLS